MDNTEKDLMAIRIKELRIKNNMSQEYLAEKLGLQKSAIAKYENGRVTNIKRPIIIKMADIFKCSPSYIMGWTDNNKVYDILQKSSDRDGDNTLLNAYEQDKIQNSVKLTTEDVELIKDCHRLNADGRERVDQFVSDILEIDKYLKDNKK